MIIRIALSEDYDKIWTIFSEVIQTGDTYVFSPDTIKLTVQKYWFADYIDAFVAVNEKQEIVGTYIIKPSR